MLSTSALLCLPRFSFVQNNSESRLALFSSTGSRAVSYPCTALIMSDLCGGILHCSGGEQRDSDVADSPRARAHAQVPCCPEYGTNHKWRSHIDRYLLNGLRVPHCPPTHEYTTNNGVHFLNIIQRYRFTHCSLKSQKIQPGRAGVITEYMGEVWAAGIRDRSTY